MKIKEAVNTINNTTETTVAKVLADDLLISRRNDFINWFLSVPIKAMTWRSVEGGWIFLDDVYPADLARVMDVVQRLLDTPVEERFPEKKYCLRWFDDEFGKTFLGFCKTGGKKYWSTFNMQTPKTIFTKSELEQLKKDNPRFAPAIDAMKEPAEDKDE
ncbi:hypothetical protein DN439_04105 [Lactobacillus reuteri]|uniref:hypothetical protein n=1 Tax=Limosilactobacillus reuteri TaxID=1598 RepID=UPI00128E64F4|nr:hypothetical protein [Limosilactobacillus reuteri]MQB72824.1 hypothetical protein [Limosilactobacillus reuteri]